MYLYVLLKLALTVTCTDVLLTVLIYFILNCVPTVLIFFTELTPTALVHVLLNSLLLYY
jgi:hypothetical protein